MSQGSFLQIALNKKKLKCERFLDEMDLVVPWDLMMAKIKPYYQEQTMGRTKTELRMLLKIYCLQQWYDLSDPGMEEAIYDRNSFQKFLDIDLLANNVPDESTNLHFRHLLEKYSLQEQFFALINDVLDKRGLFVKNGTITDATIIHAPSSTKNEAKKRDPEMSSTKKGNQYYFGMKAHIGVDDHKGLIHSVVITTAKVHDKQKFKELLTGKERAVWGDKAYSNKQDKKEFRQQGVFYGIASKGSRYVKVSNKQKHKAKKWSSVRSKVEFPFRVVKCLWRHTKVRYRGLQKNGLQFNMLFGLTNLYLVRKELLNS
ncbi:MAG: IS5 family transposase [Ignavibacteria bacterium]|nr:IS5 family transposase [Ignavibacteria bacterium]